MAESDFEKIVEGQFFPADDWYDYGLDWRFSILEPNSALGLMAIGLEQEWNEVLDNDLTSLQNDGQDDDLEAMLAEDAALEAFETAGMKRDAFKGLYRRIWQAYDPRFSFERTGMDKEAIQRNRSFFTLAIDRALTEETLEILLDPGESGKSKKTKRELSQEPRNLDAEALEEILGYDELGKAKLAAIELIQEASILYEAEEGIHDFDRITLATG